jgi:hypothetical protein
MITIQDLIDYHRKAAREAKYDAQNGQHYGCGTLDARVSYDFHLDAAALLEKQSLIDNEIATIREGLETLREDLKTKQPKKTPSREWHRAHKVLLK